MQTIKRIALHHPCFNLQIGPRNTLAYTWQPSALLSPVLDYVTCLTLDQRCFNISATTSTRRHFSHLTSDPLSFLLRLQPFLSTSLSYIIFCLSITQPICSWHYPLSSSRWHGRNRQNASRHQVMLLIRLDPQVYRNPPTRFQ